MRYQMGLSQPALAAKCQLLGWDIARDTIAKIEAQKRWVGDLELIYLARSLRVPLHRLYPESLRRMVRQL
jgi:transcriptional regulator with XRE-family HTH domain